MYAYCGQKKATLLEQLNATDAAAGAITVETFVKAKNATDGDSAAVLERFLEKAVGGKTKVGHFPKVCLAYA